MVYEPMGTRPSDWFDYAETALQHLCEGCPRERGWLALDGTERDPVCPNMLAIQDDAPGSVRKVGGRIRCAVRPPDPGPAEEAPDVDPRQMRLFGEGA